MATCENHRGVEKEDEKDANHAHRKRGKRERETLE